MSIDIERGQAKQAREVPIPNLTESAREVAKRLGVTQRLQRIIAAEVWPLHRIIKEFNATIPEIREKAQEFMDCLRPLMEELSKEHPRPWDEANSEVIGLLWGYPRVCIYSIISSICDGDREYPDESDDSPIWSEAEISAAEAVLWELIPPSEKPPTNGNPFLALFGIYELGAARVGFFLVDGQERLVVDFPLGEKYEGLVACLTLGDNEVVDDRVRFVHERFDSCEDCRFLGLLIQGRKIEDPIDLE